MTKMPLNFSTEAERRAWLIENAEMFTVIRRHKRRYERKECATLDEAREFANRWVERVPDARLMIYAVYQVHDTYVETVPVPKPMPVKPKRRK